MGLNTKGGAMLHGFLRSGSIHPKKVGAEAYLCGHSAAGGFASGLWGLLPREPLAKLPGSKGVLCAPAGLSDGDCASAEIVRLKGSFCTPAVWRERRTCNARGATIGDMKQREIGRVFGEFPARSIPQGPPVEKP